MQLEIFEKIKHLGIDEAVYFKNVNNRKEIVIKIRCNKGYAEINIKPDITQISSYGDELFVVGGTKLRDLGKHRNNAVIDKAITVKEISKLIGKPIWYNGHYCNVKFGA